MTSRMIVGCGVICDTLLTSLSVAGVGENEPTLASVFLSATALAVPVFMCLAGSLLEPFEYGEIAPLPEDDE